MASRKNDDWVSVRVSGEDREELERLAREDDRSLNGIIRLAIREFIAARKEEEVVA